MKYFHKTLIVISLIFVPLLGMSQNQDGGFGSDRQGITLTINNEKVVVTNMPQNGTIEVFNILGSKVTSFTMRNGVNTVRVNLARGYYILKIENTTKKIVIK